MVESEAMRNAMHLARSGVFYGSLIEVSLSSMALVFIGIFFNQIERDIHLAGHAWMVMYSTLFTTSVMLVSGLLGIVTTWSREKVRHNAPMVKNAALLKAIVEGSLFCYMVPFNIVVAYWICTTPGPSAWARAIKILLSAPGMFFQFGWYMACRQFWKELQKGHGEDLVMPDTAVHTFADLSEPLLPEDSSEADVDTRGVFKSASQFGPMGFPGPGTSNSSPTAGTADRADQPANGSIDVENPGNDEVITDAGSGHADEGIYSQYVAPVLNYVGLASGLSPRHPDESGWVSHGDPYAADGPSVSPVLSPSRLRRVDIDATNPDSPSIASSSDISDDKENSARGPGDPIAASLSAAASPAASGDESVLSPSIQSQGSLMRAPPKVPPLAIPVQDPDSPHAAAHPSAQASSYVSTPTPSTARPASARAAPTRAAGVVPPLPRLPVYAARSPAAPPNSAHTPTPATPRSASARIAAMLSARKLMSPMKSAKALTGSVGAGEAGLPPPSPQSDLSLSRFVNLVKNRKHAAKAAQKLPQHFAGAAAQFAVKSGRSPAAGASADGAGASSSQSMPAVSADSLPQLDGRDALSADATVFQQPGSGSPGTAEDARGPEETAAAPAGSATTPRWLPGSGTLHTHNFDGSLSSDGEFEDATSEMAPSSTTSASSAAHRAADTIFRRSSGGGSTKGAAAFSSSGIGSKVSSVWSKVKARTASGSRSGE